MWSGVYGAGSSLQHAAQLQLLSQQQILRQQELLMIQQHTAQVLELQRNAQLVVSGLDQCTCTRKPIGESTKMCKKACSSCCHWSQLNTLILKKSITSMFDMWKVTAGLRWSL